MPAQLLLKLEVSGCRIVEHELSERATDNSVQEPPQVESTLKNGSGAYRAYPKLIRYNSHNSSQKRFVLASDRCAKLEPKAAHEEILWFSTQGGGRFVLWNCGPSNEP
jgi:hypothetical protein